MDAKTVARILGLEDQYKKAVSEIGSEHECNQGCAEGHCQRYEEQHQIRLLELMDEDS